jgi:selenide,water dikinase
MQGASIPSTRDLVLIGGGHTHALVLRRWAMDPLPGVRVTLIDPGPTAAYSGMLPGFVAGHYTRDALDIDLVRLARAAGARLVMARATGFDLTARTVAVEGRPDIAYDVASVDVGITSAMPDLAGFAEHGVPAKPLGAFAAAWDAFRTGTGPARVAVIGGGVAGAEIAMAMAHGLRQAGREAEVTILERDRAFSAIGPAAGQRLRRALDAQGVGLIEGAVPTRVTAQAVELEDGRRIPADFVTGAAGARPHPWLARTALTDDRGFISVETRLRSRDPAIFAVGDCAEMVETPRPKAGVFAVRQAPVLFDNLRRELSGQGGLRPYRPQRDYLKLISLGEKSALAERFGLALAGPALWRWKDRIDQRFMEQFRDLPRRDPNPLPWPRAAGAIASPPICGGCGAKVGPDALRHALGAGPGAAIGDDAAMLDMGGTLRVLSTDHLRALTPDPVTMARIAAVHALGDVWAMGATPRAALASIMLAEQSPDLAARELAEVMAAARATMADAGAEIIGGHSTLGAEMVIGFTVLGDAAAAPISLDGASPGQALILTKPLGSGTVMAAEMQMQARGADVAAALDVMTQPQGVAARHLSRASAMTDVTGFGLVGHLDGICRASGVGARIDLAAVPLLQGALELAERGVRSTLFAQNRAPFPHLPDHGAAALLFDPQTGGGLLAAVDGNGQAELAALQADGFRAAVIGRTTDDPGQIVLE